ncbi:hypothetical protein FGO68_gene10314 [Halteria grandinella]|uniref:RDRP core domain-containing protein n=1 Tax=Halteria grandinella TaxID=5974 RepID=A0A8J8T8Z6_HALGN|nr:hypothetical protein FGO68_gene10314 [Halteria grandinella]
MNDQDYEEDSHKRRPALSKASDSHSQKSNPLMMHQMLRGQISPRSMLSDMQEDFEHQKPQIKKRGPIARSEKSAEEITVGSTGYEGSKHGAAQIESEYARAAVTREQMAKAGEVTPSMFFQEYAAPKPFRVKSKELLDLFVSCMSKKEMLKDKMLGNKKAPKTADEHYTIFDKPQHFSLGTYNYKAEAGHNIIEYVPLYPDLYTYHDLAKDKHHQIKAYCTRVTLDRNKKMRNTSAQFKEFDSMKIQFRESYQCKETGYFKETKYQMDIPFENIAKLVFTNLDRDKYRMMVVLRKPAKVFLNENKEFLQAISPFAFRRSQKQKSWDGKEYTQYLPDSERAFLNSWNVKQIIYVEGNLQITTNIESIISDIKNSDIISKVQYQSNRYEEEINLGNAEQKKKIEMVYYLSSSDPSERSPELQALHQLLLENNDRFNELLDSMIIPLRFSFMALLCARKATIFSRELIDLMENLLKENECFRKARDDGEIDEYLKSDASMVNVLRTTYTLDDMAALPQLKARPNELRNHKAKYQKTLLKTLEYRLEHSDSLDAEINKEANKLLSVQMYRLRRVFLTQTLVHFAPLQREETHRVIRKYQKFKEYFYRLTLTTEYLDKMHFGNDKMRHVLDYMIGVMGEGIQIGKDGQSKIVNYSNSQLKNHSVWMLMESKIPDIQYDSIISQLGKFSDSDGMLKMYARRGQCFTTTKQIIDLEMGKHILKIDDIKRVREDIDERDKEQKKIVEYYTFTDGCGNISAALCDEINIKFGLLKCSAYQVRLGGAKGVLMFKRFEKEEQYKNDQLLVELRPSQLKFETTDYPLEVIRCATFSQGYLNRQVILLLSNLGVPDEVFTKLLDDAMRSLKPRAVLNNLKKIYQRCKLESSKSSKSEKSRRELAAELDLFFGPSKIFGNIFKLAMIKTFQQGEEIKQEEEKKREDGEPARVASVRQQPRGAGAADEIALLERQREEGVHYDEEQKSPQKHAGKSAHDDFRSAHTADPTRRPVFDMVQEPIFESIIRTMVLGNAVNLKKKARIKVNNACVLIGCCDERGFLEEGEVFIQYYRQSYEEETGLEQLVKSQKDKEDRIIETAALGIQKINETEFVKGNVLVTKNPCSHPGDIRLLKAIGRDHPHFDYFKKDYVNVIIFSTKGKRPEQHKMSGGDLDGDVYMAIWNEEILKCFSPPFSPLAIIKEPANYKKYEADADVKSDKIEDHIKRYFQKDNLGTLSNLHLALCDQISKDGAKFDEVEGYKDKIFHLSWLISIAVDFAKHGKCVNKEQYADIEKLLTQWPDFMEGGGKSQTPVVESQNVLGKIYRRVDCKELYKEVILADFDRSVNLNYRINKYLLGDESTLRHDHIPGWLQYVDIAFQDYVMPITDELKRLMVQYKILNEGELFCTNLSFNLEDENLSKMIGDPGNKDEDAVKALNNKIKELQDSYIAKMNDFIKRKRVEGKDLARAIYFAAYFNKNNAEYADFIFKCWMISRDEPTPSLENRQILNDIQKFKNKWIEWRESQGFNEDMYEEMKDYQKYRKTLKKGKSESAEKIMVILAHKQFFSIPWLICYNQYLA